MTQGFWQVALTCRLVGLWTVMDMKGDHMKRLIVVVFFSAALVVGHVQSYVASMLMSATSEVSQADDGDGDGD